MKHSKKTPTSLMAVVLLTMLAAMTAGAAALPLGGKLVLRPLTPGDITIYKLPSTTETSPGLTTVGIGAPVYLEAEINLAIPPTNIVSVTWVLTNRPAYSAAFLTNNPLGANIPVYGPGNRSLYQVAGRALLRPDLVGQYTVVATIVTSGSGSTNVSKTITAGTYMGVNTCALCHSGGVAAEDKYTPWHNTGHARIFSQGINGELGTYRSSCIACHTAGYNANTNAIVNPVNGGFDDVAKQLGWTFPTVLAPTNWAYMQAVYPSLANLANIQCENCHGPGSQHAYSLGNTNLISRTLASGDCNQCHDAPTHHIKGAEWANSRHAVATRTPSGPTRYNCVRCHTAGGFLGFLEHAGSTNTYATNTVYEAITCTACHDPHDASTPHQLRAASVYTLPDGTAVTNAGLGALCMECHHSRNGEATNNIRNYQLGLPTWAGGSSFGVHDSTAGDMIEGVNAITYGKVIPSGSHSAVISNVCVGCHMQPVAATDPGFTKVGGHTFSMSYSVVTNGVTTEIDKVDICVGCHGSIKDFNLVRKDYNGDGVIEGIQSEVQKLADKLTTLLPNSTYRADGNYVADGLVKSPSVKTNWQTRFLNGAYNWQFVTRDGSMGIHNAPFAVGLLKTSIADLTGDSNNDTLPDSWQIQYFTSPNNPLAAPNAMPAGDGVPNWMKYLLGLNPLLPGISVTNGLSIGVVWADGNSLQNPYGATNTIQIFTAAEVAFNTQSNKTYQIQAASSVSSGWQNIGSPILGTGQALSYVTPTRKDVKQFYRVYSY